MTKGGAIKIKQATTSTPRVNNEKLVLKFHAADGREELDNDKLSEAVGRLIKMSDGGGFKDYVAVASATENEEQFFILEDKDKQHGHHPGVGVLEKRRSSNQAEFTLTLDSMLMKERSFTYLLNNFASFYNNGTGITIEQVDVVSELPKSSGGGGGGKYIIPAKRGAPVQPQLTTTTTTTSTTAHDYNLNLDFLKFPGGGKTTAAAPPSVQEFKLNAHSLAQLKSLKKSDHELNEATFGQLIAALCLHRFSGQTEFGINVSQDDGNWRSNKLVRFNFRNVATFEQILNGQKMALHGSSNICFSLANLEEEEREEPGCCQLNSMSCTSAKLLNSAELWFGMILRANEIQITIGSSIANEFLLAQFCSSYQLLLEQFLAEFTDLNQKPITEFQLLTPGQEQLITQEWNATGKEYPALSVVEMFEQMVQKNPERIAVVHGGRGAQSLSYGQLNTKANKLAHYLIQHGVGPEILVALCSDYTVEVMVAFLAILKAGGAYVPIDPKYPIGRIQHMLSDSNAPILLTQKNRIDQLGLAKNQNVHVVILDELDELIATYPEHNPGICKCNSALAYIIYTSGSTGLPKGVMIEHRNFTNYICYGAEQYLTQGEGEKQVAEIPLYSSISFDLTVTSIWTPLVAGQIVYIPSTTSIYHLADEFQSRGAGFGFVKLTPSHLELFKSGYAGGVAGLAVAGQKEEEERGHGQGQGQICCGFANTFIIGGENLLYEQVAPILLANPRALIVNEYGPTETTVGCTMYYLTPSNYEPEQMEGSIPIGKPMANVTNYVLDPQLKPVPVGVIGEIYIGGHGVGRGYINLPEMTAQKFVSDPFRGGGGKKMYRTGDLGKYLPDGNIIYVGRVDDQVKIRGFRIELSEIEAGLSQLPGVKQAAVAVKESTSGNKSLIAFLISTGTEESQGVKFTSSKWLVDRLWEKFPDYMIPSKFVLVESFPLSPGGKIDKKALLGSCSGLELVNDDGNLQAIIPPSSELEKQICSIWSKILNLPLAKIGIQSDFFQQLGGDSMRSVQLVAALRAELGISINVGHIFQYKDISRLIQHVIGGQLLRARDGEIVADQGQADGEVQILPTQLDLIGQQRWISAYLPMPTASDIDKAKLESALTKLIEHHDCLRLSFGTSNENGQLCFKYSNSSSSSVAEDEERLFKAGFQDDGRLALQFHPALLDFTSLNILGRDLVTQLYHGEEPVGKKTIGYHQWVDALLGKRETHFKTEQHFWENLLADFDSSYWELIKCNNPPGSESSTVVHMQQLELDSESTRQLLDKSSTGKAYAYNTEIQDLLLTAFGQTMAQLTGKSVTHFMFEEENGRGRSGSGAAAAAAAAGGLSLDISRTVGFFNSSYPIRLEFDPVDDADDDDDVGPGAATGACIQLVKETLRQIPNNGLGFNTFANCREKLPMIKFKYFGVLDHPWEIDLGASQANPGLDLLALSCWIQNQQFMMHVSGQFGYGLIKSVGHMYMERLNKILAHCAGQQPKIQHTMSDFPDFEPYVHYNEQNQVAPPLFMFPPVLGGSDSYLSNIVNQSPPNTSFVLFNNIYKYLSSKHGAEYTNGANYEELARQYVVYIKSIQSTGPYTLFGWSFGGVLAVEVARQLLNRGDHLEKLVLVDPMFNYPTGNEDDEPKSTRDQDQDYTNYVRLYQYKPRTQIVIPPETAVVLFKAKSDRIDQASFTEEYLAHFTMFKLGPIYEYYAKQTRDNHLADLIGGGGGGEGDGGKFELIDMEFNHYNWIHDEGEVKEIVKKLIG